MFIRVLQVLDYGRSFENCVEYSTSNIEQAEMFIKVDNICYIKRTSRSYGSNGGVVAFPIVRMVGGNETAIAEKYDDFIDKINKLKAPGNLLARRTNV